MYTKNATKNKCKFGLRGANMLKKKDVVQKSFRIHRQNDIWLGLLAAKLGRTQNELVNIAIKMLLEDNKKWFFEDFIEAEFKEAIRENGVYIKKRLGNVEVGVTPYNLNKTNSALLEMVYYEGESNDIINVGQQEVYFGPGYEARLRQALVEIFEPVLVEYPRIMKDFNPGATIDEY